MKISKISVYRKKNGNTALLS